MAPVYGGSDNYIWPMAVGTSHGHFFHAQGQELPGVGVINAHMLTLGFLADIYTPVSWAKGVDMIRIFEAFGPAPKFYQ